MCGTCYYFGWFGLERWCKHPDDPRELTAQPRKCPLTIPCDQKRAPGAPGWARRIEEKPA